MKPTRQLPLDLGYRPAMGRGDFIVGPSNAMAVAQIEGWKDWPDGRLALVGPEEAGKTHLAHVFAALTGAQIASAGDLPVDLPLGQTALVIEDLDHFAAPDIEERVFHIYNAQNAAGAPLLLTGQEPPSRWPLSLPDLISRLNSVAVARLEAPDDQLLGALMRKLFRDRQLSVPDNVVAYLTPRIERSYAAVVKVVDRLDKAALARGGDVTRPLAIEIFGSEPHS